MDRTPLDDDVAAAGLVPYPAAFAARYRAAGLWSGQTLPAELVAAAETHAEQTALITPEGSWTYRRLLDAARQFAAGLPEKTSLRPGDAVMFQMGNVAETVVAYLGCLLAGMRPVCTLPQHGVREISVLARHVGARGLILQADFGRGHLPDNARSLLADGIVEDVVVARGAAFASAVGYDEVFARGAGAAPQALPYHRCGPQQVAVFQLSGGTTGLPKVAPRLHVEYAYNSRAWAGKLDWNPGTVVLYPLPIMHNAGVSLALQPALLSGATLVLAPSADSGTLLELIEATRPQVMPLVPPAVAIRLLEDPRSKDADLSCLKDFIIGGQKLAPEIAERLRDELGISVRQKFGMAEGMFLLTPAEASEQVRHHTVGEPLSPADEIRILIPGAEDEVPDGDVGELCVRGPYTIRGYYRAPQHNLHAFTADGFYRTGDLARRHVIDGLTCYSIEGRIKDVINRGVEKIHADEVEDLMMRHPAVSNAALVAMPDPVLGERGCAYVVLEPGSQPLTVRTLGAFLLDQGLAKYKLPERVELTADLPLTNVGKVSKKALREDIESKLLRDVPPPRS
ncbi:AMP-binding protein [Catenulispora sp. NL8]|uniref:AMP-binding protein n=1 Tax=Catenulispora pinistramenti TaxID=2705254 RepID=A0ABS5KQK3_9ACTN|nr:AMP-binding protein [Catenulispora pinistramenti]MBS2548314.1 AMP-binding protein [Catenulispora pinistramenti]